MRLQIFLPHDVLLDTEGVVRIVVETIDGSYGILPNRLDCVAALEAGVLSYILDNGETNYVAVDTGVLVKVGAVVTVSVRQAKTGVALEQLYEAIQTEFEIMDERERDIHASLAKLESSLIRSMTELQS